MDGSKMLHPFFPLNLHFLIDPPPPKKNKIICDYTDNTPSPPPHPPPSLPLSNPNQSHNMNAPAATTAASPVTTGFWW